MRLIVRFLPLTATSLATLGGQSLQVLLDDTATGRISAFLSISDDSLRTLSLFELLASLNQLALAKAVQPLCPLDAALLISRSSDGALFSVQDSSDVQRLSDGSELWLIHFPICLALPPSTLHALHSGLPRLRTARTDRVSTKRVNDSSRLMREWDEVIMPCSVQRSAEREGEVWSAQSIHMQAKASAEGMGGRERSVALRKALAANGFIRVRLDSELLTAIRAMHAMQAKFFALPSPIKAHYAIDRRQGEAARYQPSFGYVSTSPSSKEYFVVRQPPTDGSTTCQLPTEVDMAPRVWPVFHELGRLAQSIVRLVLRTFDIDDDAIDGVLQSTMAPAKDSSTFGHSSVIELFLYRGATSTHLPCPIHTDASLLTLIPRSTGAAGLEIWNWQAEGWQAVEEQAADDECIVFAGDMLQRLLNGAVLATQHRVQFDQSAGIDRYSTPFELFANPHYIIDCPTLLAQSWRHFAGCESSAALAQPYCYVETALSAANWFSKGLVSVNKGD